METYKRTEVFQPNKSLDQLIAELTAILKPLQQNIQSQFTENSYPFLFIVGAPRSGTTLLLQWIASLGDFAYPTNLLNRFSYAPYLGAQIQKILFDKKYDFGNEFADLKSSLNYQSNLGKSQGALATNEFQFFFRQYMNNFEPSYLNSKELEQVNFDGIKKGLISIEKAFEKPFVVKLTMLQCHLTEIYKHIPNAIFLFVKRDPLYNMQSLLLAREKYFGNRKVWWSVKPKEYEMLKDMDEYHQVAGQVYFTNESIASEVEEISEAHKIVVNYESFCSNPDLIFDILSKKLDILGFSVNSIFKKSSSFVDSNINKISVFELDKLEKAYSYFFKNY